MTSVITITTSQTHRPPFSKYGRPHFGSTGHSQQLIQQAFRKMPVHQQLAGQFLRLLERNSKGSSILKSLQDTVVAWIPKMLVSRSGTERFEISFLEFVESAYNYFAPPVLGEKGFKPLLSAVSGTKIPAKYLTTPMAKVPKHLYSKVLSLRAGIILSSVFIINIAGNYGLHFVKNLLTDKIFKKNRFSDIINLSSTPHIQQQESAVAKKAKNRIKLSLAISAGLLGVSILLARFGRNMKALQKPLDTFVRFFDFDYHANGGFGLSRNQLRFALFPINIFGYIDAARDYLERVEVACRTIVVGGYLCFMSDMFQDTVAKRYGNQYPGILKTTNGNKVKTFLELAQDATQQAKTLVIKNGKAVNPAIIRRKALDILAPQLRGKIMLAMNPLLFGMGVIGLGAAAFNRYWTAYRYKQEAVPGF